jgi:O-antigen/teichoic acid export membrane protein
VTGTVATLDSIFRPAFVLMAGRALGFLALFAVPVVLARVFDPGEFGTYKQLFLVYSTLFMVAQLGMAESLFYFLPTAPRAGGRYTVNAMLLLAAAGAICCAALWGGRAVVAAGLNNAALADGLPLIGAFLTLMLVAAVLEIVLTARKRHGQASATYALSDVLRAALLVAPVLWSGGLEALLWGAVAAAALRAAAALLILRREYGSELRPDAALARAQLAYAAPFATYVLVEAAQSNLHLYVVSSSGDAATFAIYAVGCLSIPLVDFLMSTTCNVMMVRMREHLLAGARARMLEVWRDTTRKLALLFAPLVGGLLVVAPEVIRVLFTSTYERSTPVFAVWLLTVLPVALLTDGVLRVHAQMRFLLAVAVVKLVLLALLLGPLLAAFGLPGAVLAVLLVSLAGKAIALARVRQVLRCSAAEVLPWGELAQALAIAATAGAAALAVKATLQLADLPTLLVTGAAYAATYTTLLWRLGPLTDGERSALIGWVRRPLTSASYGRGA